MLGILAAIVIAVGIPICAAAGDLTITPSLTFSEEYTDNVDSDPDGLSKAALVTEVTPGIRIRSESARVEGALDSSLTFRHQTAGDDKGHDSDVDLTGLGTVEVAEDLFFVEAQASLSQQVLDNDLAATAANQELVQVYRFSPFLRHRLGNFADAEARYTLSQSFVGGESDVSDSTTHGLAFMLGSGRDFSRLGWILQAGATEESRSDDDDVSRSGVDLGVEYAIARSFSVIGGAGYQMFDDGVPANEIDGPTWRAGFRWRPGRRTELEFTYGQRDGDQNAAADFRYDIGPRTRFTARFVESLSTSQERLVENLSAIGVDEETRNFIGEQTGLAFNPNPSPFDIQDETTRTTTFRVGINGERGRNAFGFTAAMQNQEIESTGEEEDIISANVRWARRLNPRLTLNLVGGYENIEFADGSEDTEYSFTGGLSYSLFANVQGVLSYAFRTQDSTVQTSEFTENRVMVSLRASF